MPARARARAARPPRHLADLDAGRPRAAAVAELGLPGFRADQLSRHYFGRLTDDPGRDDRPARRRRGTRWPRRCCLSCSPPTRELTCDQGLTRKTLWRAPDGSLVESVLMRYPARVTDVRLLAGRLRDGLPVLRDRAGRADPQPVDRPRSSPRSLTGLAALARGEMPGGPGRISNVVFMGMGEPLANYAERGGRRAADQRPGAGRVRDLPAGDHRLDRRPGPGDRRLAAEGLSVRLAVSLHAPDDELRDELVPVNRRWKVAEVLDAAWGYAAATGRRVSIEYAMIRDINDQAWRADALAGLLAGRLAHVNLIPLNPTPGSRWTASDPGVSRSSRIGWPARHPGDRPGHPRPEIDGACGQLAAAGRTVPGRRRGRAPATAAASPPP